ncbi:serine hydrolase domain-containing protein [Flavobacterium sp.]|uniref:serine hydrolase domain-containing protein n=1 Tax=Flavobacterium sp. TaxID=239 RepID=UPI00262B6716|nr:serine hydrolase domain-containing protein [Flavobacterium sp.]
MKKLLKILAIIVLVISIVILGLFAFIKYKTSNLKDGKDLASSINKLGNTFIKEGNSNALVIGVYKDGIVHIKGYGTKIEGKNITPDETTLFELASTSKLFTTSTLQLLVDENQLKLEDKLQPFLKDKVVVSKTAQNTTLQHLATHLSGFPSLPDSFLSKMNDETNPYKDLVTQDIYDYLKICKGKKPEGEFEYSNFGMGLLGHLMELKTNTKYEELVKTKLLKPLEMNSTFVTIDATNKENIIQGYDKQNNKAPIWKDDVLTGAGSFISNADDMIKFIKANLNEKETKLSRSLIKTHEQQLKGETGLGWILPSSADKLLGNGSIVWHNGMAGGYASFLAIDKKNNYGIIILSNKAVDVTKLGMKLAIVCRTQSWKNN